MIAGELFSFYRKLYPSAFSVTDADSFNHISALIPHIDEELAELCNVDITSDELDKAVKSLTLNKSLGCDGLTANFYKHFWELLKSPVTLMLKGATDNLTFPHTMKQGLITLIPKRIFT